MYNFNNIEEKMSFRNKLAKHVDANDCIKIKDYICTAYDSFNPENFEEHPCFDSMLNAFKKILKPNGWKVGTMNWKDKGIQLVVTSPDNEYYRSHFDHIANSVIKPNVIIKEEVNNLCVRTNSESLIVPSYRIILDYGSKEKDREVADNKNITSKQRFPTKDGQGRIHLDTYDNGFVTYGYEAFDEDNKPGHGGLWSSNPNAVHNVTGQWFHNVTIGYGSWFNLPVDEIKKIIPDEYVMIYIPDGVYYSSRTWQIIKKSDLDKVNDVIKTI